jgi:hypothetical protein
LEVLRIVFLVNHLSTLQTIPALSSMSRLLKIYFFHVKIIASSLTAFESLKALTILVCDHCHIKCQWSTFGVALARTPLKNITLRNIDCSVDDIESFLDVLRLDNLYLSNFRPTFAPAVGVFLSFQAAFCAKRQNPRECFLIEEDGYARNHNGVITKQNPS